MAEHIDNQYRDDKGASGMQAQLAEGSAAERVQGVIADEAMQANANFMQLVETIKELIVGIKKLVSIIGVLVIIVGVGLMYLVARNG